MKATFLRIVIQTIKNNDIDKFKKLVVSNDTEFWLYICKDTKLTEEIIKAFPCHINYIFEHI